MGLNFEIMKELGGFAEEPEYVSDAYTKEDQQRDYEAFNYCLAEDYVSAMYQEDFESLGEVDDYLFNNICTWINYDPELGNADLVKSIKEGSLLTEKGRSFLSAIVAAKNISWATLYTDLKVYNPEIITMLIECAGANECVFPVFLDTKSEEELHELHLGIFDEIEKRYHEEGNDIKYLYKIRDGFGILRIKKDQKTLRIPMTYSWAQALKSVSKK